MYSGWRADLCQLPHASKLGNSSPQFAPKTRHEFGTSRPNNSSTPSPWRGDGKCQDCRPGSARRSGKPIQRGAPPPRTSTAGATSETPRAAQIAWIMVRISAPNNLFLPKRPLPTPSGLSFGALAYLRIKSTDTVQKRDGGDGQEGRQKRQLPKGVVKRRNVDARLLTPPPAAALWKPKNSLNRRRDGCNQRRISACVPPNVGRRRANLGWARASRVVAPLADPAGNTAVTAGARPNQGNSRPCASRQR